MTISRRSIFRLATLAALIALAPNGGSALAAGKVRIGVLKFGTVSWELDTLKHHEFDAANGIDLEVTFFAGEDATNVAMLAGAIDVIVSDWLWVSRQRSEGGDVTLVPYSTAVGAIMVREDSPIRAMADLKDRKIGVAGGPLDKSWLLIQALAKRDHGVDLAASNEIVFGAPPLMSEKAMQGELDAVLNFWHFCARLEVEWLPPPGRRAGRRESARRFGSGVGARLYLPRQMGERKPGCRHRACQGLRPGQGPAGQIGR